MIKSISYWTFPGGLENTADYGEVFRRAKSLGYEAVEAGFGETGVLTPDSTEAQCERIKKEAAEAGVKIASVATGIYWSYSLAATSEATRKKAVDLTKAMLRVAKMLGTDAVLVVPGAVNVFFDPAVEVVPYDEVWKLATRSIKKCLNEAKKQRVTMCLENVWNKFLLSPMEMVSFIKQFKSPHVKCYFDTGNVIVTGYPEQWIRILGNKLGRVHFKDFKWEFVGNVNEVPGFAEFARGQAWGTMAAFCDLGAGDVDWPAVIAALKSVKYKGPVTAEMLPPGEGLLERTSADMDRILGRA